MAMTYPQFAPRAVDYIGNTSGIFWWKKYLVKHAAKKKEFYFRNILAIFLVIFGMHFIYIVIYEDIHICIIMPVL